MLRAGYAKIHFCTSTLFLLLISVEVWLSSAFVMRILAVIEPPYIFIPNPPDKGGVCYLLFSCIYVCLLICVGPPGQMKNDTDLKGTHTPLDLI